MVRLASEEAYPGVYISSKTMFAVDPEAKANVTAAV